MMEHFSSLDIRAGTVLEAFANPKAKNPALVLKIDFGPEIGIKTSSAQISQLYTPKDLISTQVLALINVPPRRVASILSEVLVLGLLSPKRSGVGLIPPEQGTPTAVPEGAVLIRPERPVPNGSRLF